MSCYLVAYTTAVCQKALKGTIIIVTRNCEKINPKILAIIELKESGRQEFSQDSTE